MAMDGDAEGFVAGLMECFAELEDPRVEKSCEHGLFDILAIAVLSVASGADDWCDMATFARIRLDWLQTFLELPVVVDALDQQLQQPALLSRAERFPYGVEFGHRVGSLCFVDQVAAHAIRLVAYSGRVSGPLCRHSSGSVLFHPASRASVSWRIRRASSGADP